MPPRLARLLAAVVAIALVAGAFAVRGVLSGDDDDDRPGRDAPGGDEYRLICDADLGEAACAAVAQATEAEVDTMTWAEVQTADDLASYDAWLTLDAMAGLLDAARGEAGQPSVAGDEAKQVASAGFSLLTIGNEVDCPEGDWPCLADAAGTLDVGLPSLDSATGVVAAGAAFLALAPEAEERGLAALSDEVRSQLDDLVSSKPGRLKDQHSSIVTQRGSYDGVVTTSFLADRRVELRPTEGLDATPITPAVTVGVVLAGLGSRGDEAVRTLGEAVREQTVVDALTEAGWDGEPASSKGLPAADVIYALQEDLGS